MATPFESNLVPIGSVQKAVGYKGNLIIHPYEGFEKTWAGLKKCLIKEHGIWAPFFVQSLIDHEAYLEVKFYEVNESQQVVPLIHQEVFVLRDHVEDQDDAEVDLSMDWIGFEVSDTEKGVIGLINDIESLPGQEVIYVYYQERLITIPLVEELIVDIDLDKKKIQMDLPEGLLDL